MTEIGCIIPGDIIFLRQLNETAQEPTLIRLATKVPHTVAVAASGGPDSMAALSFFGRTRKVRALSFDHGTKDSCNGLKIVREYCTKNNIPLHVGKISSTKPKGDSWEAYWRDERYKFFGGFSHMKIITAHHLDDAVENWIFTSLRGKPRIIPVERDNFIRPFITTPKSELISWVDRHNVPYYVEPSNTQGNNARAIIRREMMDAVLKVTPGIRTTIRKKYENL